MMPYSPTLEEVLMLALSMNVSVLLLFWGLNYLRATKDAILEGVVLK